jgi:predicted phosphodiesterase
MAGLPRTLRFTLAGLTAQVIHGGVTQINRFVFPSECAAVADELERTDADILIAGHCGIPFIERAGRRIWFNPGAIGMPANDGTPDTWFGLIRSKTGNVVLSTHRLAYDLPVPRRRCEGGVMPITTATRS